MSVNRKDARLDIKLSSSITGTGELKRHFCIIRNISKTGAFLTSKVRFVIGQTVECIISFEGKSINFFGIIRRVAEDENGQQGYGIEIIEISDSDDIILEEFIESGYLPKMDE